MPEDRTEIEFSADADERTRRYATLAERATEQALALIREWTDAGPRAPFRPGPR